MRRVIFYSWQSDLPNSTNRGFIQDALGKAAKKIAADDSIDVEPVVDRDTQGVAGAPDIASTIFAKIAGADVFVADVSIIYRPRGKRQIPNPNVLIELGYALKALGHESVVLVFNEAFGKPDQLPFDLRGRRLVLYRMPKESRDRTVEKASLTQTLQLALRVALENARPIDDSGKSIESLAAIENGQPNRIVVLRKDLKEIWGNLVALEPQRPRDNGTVGDLIDSIQRSQEPIAEFSKIAESVAVANDIDCLREIVRWFGNVVEKYANPRGFSGSFSNADFDYFRFIGHEMFVTTIAFLLREQRWDSLKSALAEPIPVRYLRQEEGPGSVFWEYISRSVNLLVDEAQRKQRASLHADILNERHTTGGLAANLPMEDFMAADYFLFLCSALSSQKNTEKTYWYAWSTLYLDHAPLFLQNAEQADVAHHLVSILGLNDIDAFKARLKEEGNGVHRFFPRAIMPGSPLGYFEIDKIGTRPRR